MCGAALLAALGLYLSLDIDGIGLCRGNHSVATSSDSCVDLGFGGFHLRSFDADIGIFESDTQVHTKCVAKAVYVSQVLDADGLDVLAVVLHFALGAASGEEHRDDYDV